MKGPPAEILMTPSAPMSEEPVDISVVVISRNEEGNIVECLEAVFRTIEAAKRRDFVRSFEVVLVDSASTDRTVEFASRFPIALVRLRAGWPLSASAGKATGARLTSGRIVLFVDGDFFLDSEWFPIAWPLLGDPEVAAVSGWDLDEVSGNTILAKHWRDVRLDDLPEVHDVDSLAAGLVKREAYEAVGGLHPYLRGAEDRDFGLRLRAQGWRVIRTRHPMGTHRFARPGEPMTYVEYYRSVARWSLGEGEACRARWADRGLRRSFLRRYGTTRFVIQDLQLLGVALLVLLNLLGALAGGLALVAALLGNAFALFAFGAWGLSRGRRWRETVYAYQGAIYGPLRQVLFTLGLLTTRPPPDAYPKDVEILRGKTQTRPHRPDQHRSQMRHGLD